MDLAQITEEIAQQIITYLGYKEGEPVVLIKDKTTEGIIDPVSKTIKDPIIVSLDKYKRPLTSVPKGIEEKIEKNVLCFYAVSKQGPEEIEFRRGINTLVEEKNGRVGNMMDLTPALVEQALSHDANQIKEFTEKVFKYMKKVKSVKVQTERGTDATFEFCDITING